MVKTKLDKTYMFKISIKIWTFSYIYIYPIPFLEFQLLLSRVAPYFTVCYHELYDIDWMVVSYTTPKISAKNFAEVDREKGKKKEKYKKKISSGVGTAKTMIKKLLGPKFNQMKRILTLFPTESKLNKKL